MSANPAFHPTRPPEELLADAIRRDLNVEINPQALRMFVRSRWDRISDLAHSIHGSEGAREFRTGEMIEWTSKRQGAVA